MKYIGNKNRLLPFIDEIVTKTSKGCRTFCDIFTGTTNVAQYYKRKGYKIISNDIMTFSYVLQTAYIKNNSIPNFTKLFEIKKKYFNKLRDSETLFRFNNSNLAMVIRYLNNLEGITGFIYKNYTNDGTKETQYKRQYYTEYNALKIDADRQQIESWKKENLIDENEYYTLLASLIDEADYLANICGTYGAFLKIWRSVAKNKFHMKVPALIQSDIEHEVYQEDSNVLIDRIKSDVLYIDPPYNTRQYAANFHIPETIACYDNPDIYGKTGLRPYKNQASRYCSKSEAGDALNDLIKKAACKYIYLSYNNEGIIPTSSIEKILKSKGTYKRYQKIYRRFRTERDHEKRKYKDCDDKTVEFLHFCEVK